MTYVLQVLFNTGRVSYISATHACSFSKQELFVNVCMKPPRAVSGVSHNTINPLSAKFLKICPEMEWVDLWQLL